MRTRGALFIAGVCCLPIFAAAQVDTVITIATTLGDTTETFWLQIPESYQPSVPAPLLIGWHQWGGDYLEFKNQTDFDSLADARGWIAASHYGVSSTHWNNHPTQSHVVDVINWIAAHYAVDQDRIYMVGSSMGGAAAMVFSNNHLDPDGPMVAAAASVSGIQDCERRFYEQGINYSMISAFGGTPEEVPYEYHRNSAIYFDDYSESMHFNAQHLPLYLTFGRAWTDSVWRCHAEDLYAVMAPFADTVVIHESSLPGHGWSNCEADLICDFLENFTVNRYPSEIDVNADEPGQWYWANITMRDSVDSFARFQGSLDTTGTPRVYFDMIHNLASALLDLPAVGFHYDRDFFCQWNISEGLFCELSFASVPIEPLEVFRDGAVYDAWTYDPEGGILTLEAADSGSYTVILWGSGGTSPYPSKRKSPPFTLTPNASGTLIYRTDIPATISWELYNILGRKASSRSCFTTMPGEGLIRLPAQLPGGVYFLRLTIHGDPSAYLTRKVVILR